MCSVASIVLAALVCNGCVQLLELQIPEYQRFSKIVWYLRDFPFLCLVFLVWFLLHLLHCLLMFEMHFVFPSSQSSGRPSLYLSLYLWIYGIWKLLVYAFTWLGVKRPLLERQLCFWSFFDGMSHNLENCPVQQ